MLQLCSCCWLWMKNTFLEWPHSSESFLEAPFTSLTLLVCELTERLK